MKVINHPSIIYATSPILVEMPGEPGSFLFRRDVLRHSPVMGETIWVVALEILSFKSNNTIVHDFFKFQKSYKLKDNAKREFCKQVVTFRRNLPLWEELINEDTD